MYRIIFHNFKECIFHYINEDKDRIVYDTQDVSFVKPTVIHRWQQGPVLIYVVYTLHIPQISANY